MSAKVSTPTNVYTTTDGHAVIEAGGTSFVLTSEQILTVIRDLHVCYDYCAAWKESADSVELPP